MRGATFEDSSYEGWNDDCAYDKRTDSWEIDPFNLIPQHFPIAAITESVAVTLFPELKGRSDILPVYCEKSAKDIEAAWRQVLAEHDEENR